MANLCSNTLKVSGPDEEIKKLREKMKGREIDWGNRPQPEKDAKLEDLEFDFNQFVPVPEDVREKGYSDAGHEWCNHYWGTKWNCNEPGIEQEEEMLIVNFVSAWNPPTPVIKAMGKMFPGLTFQLDYEEGGERFMGTYIVARGRVTVNSRLRGDDFVSGDEEE